MDLYLNKNSFIFFQRPKSLTENPRRMNFANIFVNSNKVAAEHGFDVVHFDFVSGCVLKNQVVINQVKNPIYIGMFE